jgi:hypothetical protein
MLQQATRVLTTYHEVQLRLPARPVQGRIDRSHGDRAWLPVRRG